jgi:hypothetical protein
MKNRRMFALGSGLLLGATGVVNAETAPSTAELQAKLADLQAKVSQLEGQQSSNWLNERRAEEVKALVREVLNDADTRASLAAEGMTAGHNGRNFFISSEDGNFLMNISGQLQVRWIYNDRDDAGTAEDGETDEEQSGFTIRRAKVQFDGHIVNPNWLYVLRLSADRDTTDIGAEEVTIGYRITDEITARVGRSKSPFLREELTSSAYQLTVERSLVNEIFTAGYTEGLYVSWDAPYNDNMFRLAASIDDGDFSGEPDGDFGGNDWEFDASEWTMGARLDVKVMGDWNQMKDFTTWSGEETGLFVGAAFRWTEFETGDGGTNGSQIKWTVDASLEMAGFNVFGAIVGAHFDDDEDETAGGSTDSYGLVLQGGYNINDKWEPFVRYEYIDLESDGAFTKDHVDLLTVGVNYYIARHSAKASLDLVWVMDELDSIAAGGAFDTRGLDGLGLLSNINEEDQVAVRAQVQLLF